MRLAGALGQPRDRRYLGPHAASAKAKPFHFETNTITAFGIGADGRSAWIAGPGFLAYVEDHGAKGDLFKLWIDGALQTGPGALDSGKITVR